MNIEVSTLLGKMQSMLTEFISLLPNMVLALIVFAVFFFIARAIKKVVKNLTRDRREARSLGMVLGRLAQGVTILVGLFVALSIVIPSLKAGDLVQLLGVSSVAIGFAFRDNVNRWNVFKFKIERENLKIVTVFPAAKNRRADLLEVFWLRLRRRRNNRFNFYRRCFLLRRKFFLRSFNCRRLFLCRRDSF